MVDTAVNVARLDQERIRRLWARAALGAVVVTVGLSASGSLTTAALSNFMVVFSSLLLQAIPLVMLGAFVAAVIGTFVPDSTFQRIGGLPESLQIPVAAVAGFGFPVCECGSVPVARRLIDRGLVPSAAVTFMLAAPILNPIVIVSTAIAYRGRDIFWPMVLGRVGLGLLAAMAVGWVVGARSRENFLKPLPRDEAASCGCHDGSHCGCEASETCDHDHDESRATKFFNFFSGDFAYMGRFLIFGSAMAAGMQTLLPQSVLSSVANTPIVSLLAMMVLAFALSLCSESDAFIAASFVQFGVGPQLAFLVFGPMVDFKLAFLYSATFSKGFFRTVLGVVTIVTLVGTLWIEVLAG